jgi:hypothetical protein
MGFGCGLAGYLLRFLLIALAASRT